jgi:hypothetical protein
LGLFVPKAAVVLLYFMIYRAVDDARKLNRMISRTTINATSSHNIVSVISTSAHTDGDSSKGSSNKVQATERESFPWSLLVVLMLNFVSCAPWIVLIGAPELLYRGVKSEFYIALDLVYSTLLVATAANPLAYLITTRVVRKKTIQCFKNCFCFSAAK